MTAYTAQRRMVYFIRPIGMNGPVKIGCSFAPERRRASLETWSPFPLEIVAEIGGSLDIERQFHTLFADLWQSREWFRWSPELQLVIDEIAAGKFDVGTLPEARTRKSTAPRRTWTEEAKRKASYRHRLRATQKRTGQHLPYGFVWSMSDPDSLAKVDAYLADPFANGISKIEWMRVAISHLRGRKDEWARQTIAQWEAEHPELRLAA